jgi:hypothetical protein
MKSDFRLHTVLLLLVFLSGCSANTTREASSSAASGKSDAVSSSGEKRTDPESAAGDAKEATDSQPGQAAVQDPIAAKEEVESPGRDEKASAPPTPEQLARWQLPAYEPLQLLACRDGDNSGFVSFLALTSDGKNYLLGGVRLTLWEINGTKPVHEFIAATTAENELLTCFALSPVNDWCLAGNASGLLRKFDIVGRKETGSVSTGTDPLAKVAVSPDGLEIATIPEYGKEVTMWNAETLEKAGSIQVDASEIKFLFYLEPKKLIVGGDTMSCWDTATGDKVTTWPSARYQTATAISPNGKELLFGADEFLQRWDLAEGRASGEYRFVPFRTAAVRYSTDGALLAVATGNAIHLVDAASGQLVQVVDGAGSTISNARWVPGTHLLIVVADSGRTRIWGRPVEGESFGLSPVHGKGDVATPAPGEPANVAENMAMIDVRSLPVLPDSKPLAESYAQLTCQAPVNTEEVKAFYRYVFSERGWREVVDGSAPQLIQFQKKDHRVTVSLFGDNPAETGVSITFCGNCDLRRIPKLNDWMKESVLEGQDTVIYKVASGLLEIETALLRTLHQAGWTAVVGLASRQMDRPDSRNLEFVRNGTKLLVMVQKDDGDPKLFSISYSRSLTLHSLPVPPDAGLVEWEDYREAQMIGNTSMSLEEATTFYESEMKKQGWVLDESRRVIEKDQVFLSWFREQREVPIGLNLLADGKVRIVAGLYSDLSWQTESESTENEAPAGGNATTEEGIEAADLPIFHAANAPAYDASRGGGISFKLEKIPLLEVAEEYRKHMQSLGWTAEPFGEPGERDVNLNFEKGERIIYYRSFIDPVETASVQFSGNGLMWNKPIASQQLISYSEWLRNNKFPATLERLDEYQKEMEEIQSSRRP